MTKSVCYYHCKIKGLLVVFNFSSTCGDILLEFMLAQSMVQNYKSASILFPNWNWCGTNWILFTLMYKTGNSPSLGHML